MKGTGVPLAFKKYKTDQKVTAIPITIKGIDNSNLASSGTNRGKFSSLSTNIAASIITVRIVLKIMIPIGVRRVLVFLLPVAILLNKLIKISRNFMLVNLPDCNRYHWWVAEDFYFAMGCKGQFTFVIPNKNMVVVFTSSLLGQSLGTPYKY